MNKLTPEHLRLLLDMGHKVEVYFENGDFYEVGIMDVEKIFYFDIEDYKITTKPPKLLPVGTKVKILPQYWDWRDDALGFKSRKSERDYLSSKEWHIRFATSTFYEIYNNDGANFKITHWAVVPVLEEEIEVVHKPNEQKEWDSSGIKDSSGSENGNISNIAPSKYWEEKKDVES